MRASIIVIYVFQFLSIKNAFDPWPLYTFAVVDMRYVGLPPLWQNISKKWRGKVRINRQLSLITGIDSAIGD
jgi:hypothetical protein